ncbi:PVC-type heme-binding CxxCH protein [Spirosoma fluviale]|uniref:Putative membrane-bound dehydrogenase domain-containing protein n=1 Tax=Spirosoma fluviale TaxID=1597977 RepID=A0A286GN37_9BACT|nr:PVC-type heme-binding CxxCH protein [Spirosoma fluviale]SOD96586.1 putative membrane-bound dehydrogenase domain-containing protein [Spirosoma fluviale]
MKAIFSSNPLPFVLTTFGFLYLAGQTFRPTTQFGPPLSGAEPSRQHSMVVSADSNTLYLPNDLEATLWAEAPMFYNPTNMDIDAKGRVWITEAVNYRKFNNKPDSRLDHPEGERIVILEDTNGDGKADDSKVFVTDPDLVSPLGIAVVGNKVIVSAAPNLVVYTDENGDDKPDKKEVMLTGFGGLDHDHSLHAVVAGPDGKYYFNTGNAGPHIVSDKDGWTLRSGSLYVGGTPYNKANKGNQVSDDGRIWTGGMALRINPDGSNLKVMAHNFRNNYETALDSYGNMWQNDNDDQVVACRTSFLMEGANAGYFSSDGTRYWQGDQRPGQTIPIAHWHQEDPGVMPAGDISGAGSPTGMVMYEGDELGPQYRGMLLSAEAGRNVIFSYKPEPMGAGYRMPRTDFISTFPEVDPNYKWDAATDDTRKWFRPSDVAVGPDGAIYIADWYDPVVGGHQMKDAKGYGRIYRITPKGKKLKTPKIDLRNIQGQIAALLNPAVNVRMMGFEALVAQGEKAVEPVMGILSSSNPFHRARAIYLLAQLGAEGQFEVERLLKAVDAPVRLTAFRALRSITPENSKSIPALTASQKALLPLMGNLSVDKSAAVRREVAIALRDVPFDNCRFLLMNLVKGYDGQDPWYLDALEKAADGKEEALFFELQQIMPKNPVEWDQRAANLVWEFHPPSAVTMLKKRAASPSLSADARKQSIVALGFIKTPQAAQAMVELSKLTDKDVADQALYWMGFRRGNDWAKFLNWEEVMPTKVSSQEQKMLTNRQILLDEYKSDTEKRRIALEMARDPEGGKILVGLAADKKLSDKLVKAVTPTLLKNPDQSVRTMAKEYFSVKSEAPASDETASVAAKPASVATAEPAIAKPAIVSTSSSSSSDPVLDQIAMLSGNERTGKTVFSANCATCHKHGQLGSDVGPELTKIHQKFDKNGLLDAILHPSAGIAFGYEPWLITTKTGQTFYGFLVSDNDQAVVVRGIKGPKHTIPADQVSSKRQYKTSLMPDPVAMGLSNQQVADLTAFLLKQ